MALGHPIGASGARVLTTLLYALRDRGGSTGPGDPMPRRRQCRGAQRGGALMGAAPEVTGIATAEPRARLGRRLVGIAIGAAGRRARGPDRRAGAVQSGPHDAAAARCPRGRRTARRSRGRGGARDLPRARGARLPGVRRRRLRRGAPARTDRRLSPGVPGRRRSDRRARGQGTGVLRVLGACALGMVVIHAGGVAQLASWAAIRPPRSASGSCRSSQAICSR